MPSDWFCGVTLIDDDSKKTSLRFIIGTITGVDFAAEAQVAYDAFDNLVTDIKAVTDANVNKAFLRAEDPGDWVDSGIPSNGSDVSDELVVSVHTNDTFLEKEVDQLRMPAPLDAMWVNGEPSQGLDKTNALLQAFVGDFETDIEFSDGEHVNTSEGTSGIADGYWRSVKKDIR
jgi:hypothetical protein